MHAPTTPTRRAASRRGVSLIEAVLSVVLLGMVATTIAGAVSFLQKSQTRQNERLGAAELANRMVVQFLDEKDAMPSPSLPIEYNRKLYRWRLEETAVEYRVDPAGREAMTGRNGLRSDRARMITVTVWLSEKSGGSRGYSGTVPSAALTRLFDPLGVISRNPDSTQKMFETQEGINQYINELMNISQGRGGASP